MLNISKALALVHHFLLLSLRLYVKKIFHISPNVLQFLHICPGLLVGSIGFSLWDQQISIFLSKGFYRRQLGDAQLVKVFLGGLVDQNLCFMGLVFTLTF